MSTKQSAGNDLNKSLPRIDKNGHTIKKSAPDLDTKAFEGGLYNPNTNVSDNVYIPTWYNRPIERPPVLKLNDTSILTPQNTAVIIAAPGIGKTSLCEAIPAAYLNPNVDCLGFAADTTIPGVIMIDFERAKQDVWKGRYRIAQRAGIKHGAPMPGFVMAGMRAVPRLQERLTEIEKLLINNPCGLLILDGAGDMVTDSNDLLQAIECRIFLRELTVKYNLAIFTTLHPNPNSSKPRGHIGSEMLREAETALLAKKLSGENRILTTDFELGKSRNAGHATTGYYWSVEHNMFLSSEVDTPINDSTTTKLERIQSIIQGVLPPETAMSYMELVRLIIGKAACSEPTAKRYVTAADVNKWLTKRMDGKYMLTQPVSGIN